MGHCFSQRKIGNYKSFGIEIIPFMVGQSLIYNVDILDLQSKAT